MQLFTKYYEGGIQVMFMRDANFSLLCIDFFFSPLILICMIIFSSPVQDDIQLAFRLFSFAN